MAFGLAGAATGAAKSLEDIVAQRILEQKLEEEIADRQQRAEMATAALNQRTLEADTAAKQRQQQIDLQAGAQRERSNQTGVRRMLGEAITQRTGPMTSDDRRGLAALQVEAGDAPTLLNEPKPERDPIADYEERKKIDRKYDRPAATAPEHPSVWVSKGSDMRFVTPTEAARLSGEGWRSGQTREQGRPVVSGDANRIADYDTSLNDLSTLSTALDESNATGTAAKVGASMPNFVTEYTGWGTDAKKKQALIDRVKQVIGKTLEGGVLRKEDEIKYEKILPTIADVPEVVASKLAGLSTAITQRRQTTLDSLSDAGYDTSRFAARAEAQKKTLSMADAQALATKRGVSVDEVIQRARAKGYTIQQ